MLEEDEWEIISPLVAQRVKAIKKYLEETGASIDEAAKHVENEASTIHLKLTGYKEENSSAIAHHRLANFGAVCAECGHLYRTPKARFCANCGSKESENKVG